MNIHAAGEYYNCSCAQEKQCHICKDKSNNQDISEPSSTNNRKVLVNLHGLCFLTANTG